MMTLARMVGIRVPAFGLVDVDAVRNLPAGVASRGDKAFIIDRFDRSDEGSRVHTEDFAQVFDVDADKNTSARVFDTLLRSLQPSRAMRTLRSSSGA